MKIVFVAREYVPSQRCGGIGSCMKDMARALTDMGHRVTVVCASDDTRRNEELDDGGVRVIRLPGGDFCIGGVEYGSATTRVVSFLRSFTRRRSYRTQVARTVRRLITEGSADIVVAPEYGAEASVLSHRRTRAVPLVTGCHGPSLLDHRTGERMRYTPWRHHRYRLGLEEYRVLKRSERIYACSSALADYIARDAGIDRQRIAAIANPVDTAFWQSPLPSAKDLESASRTDIFFAGSLVDAKGVRELGEATRLLHEAGMDIHVTFAGRIGSAGRELATRAQRDDTWRSLITLPGHLSREALRDHYRSAALVCLPSWWESFGLTCVEAMSSGGLVIGSTAGGMQEIITPGQDGFLAPPRDAGALARLMGDALALPPERQLAIRSAAQETARTRFGAATVAAELVELLAQAIHGKGRK